MIINADDFGYNSKINRAIVESFERGYCSSTTIMINMPGFDEASQLLHERRLQNHTGIHFVLTEGSPLTDDIRKCHRFCNQAGLFNFSRKKRVFRLSVFEKSSLSNELRAQINRCRKSGIFITHADSHKHAHEEWAIASIVIKICHEESIPYLRLARNCGQWRKRSNRIYRHILNFRLSKAGLARTPYFGSVQDCKDLFNKKGITDKTRSIEVMIHPEYDTNGVLIDLKSEVALANIARSLGHELKMESYSGHEWVRK
jgi:predicted glycoside hydrolase/deacetylase ChbG (UPF0249 family)